MITSHCFVVTLILIILGCVPFYEAKRPLVINTWAFNNATRAAWLTLTTGGNTAVDALVAGCSTCETEQCDYTVGYGGSPDENGDVRLDALIMDGRTMNIGAVASLKNIRNVIGVAKHVLLHTKHSIIAGDAAMEFAKAMGFKEEPTNTELSTDKWQQWKNNNCQPNFWIDVTPNPQTSCGPYRPLGSTRLIDEETNDVRTYHRKVLNYDYARHNHDTIGMIVIDYNGNIAAGTSTNGATHKIPGRVGDSPIPGAGAYATNEVGAAAATGDGDILVRFLPSFHAVEELRKGASPSQAARTALNRIIKYYNFMGAIIVADKLGNYGAACYGLQYFPFRVYNEDSQDVQEVNVQCIG